MESACPKPHFPPGCKYSQSTEVVHLIETGDRYRTRRRRRGASSDPTDLLFDADGRLRFPPPEYVQLAEERARSLKEERARRLRDFPGNVVSLSQLRSECRPKKPVAARRRSQQSPREAIAKEVSRPFSPLHSCLVILFPTQTQWPRVPEAEPPNDVECQLEVMKRLFEEEARRYALWPEQEETIRMLTTKCGLSTDVYDPAFTQGMEKRIAGRLKRRKE